MLHLAHWSNNEAFYCGAVSNTWAGILCVSVGVWVSRVKKEASNSWRVTFYCWIVEARLPDWENTIPEGEKMTQVKEEEQWMKTFRDKQFVVREVYYGQKSVPLV